MVALLALAKLIHPKDILYFPLQKSVKRFEAALMLAPEQSTQVEVRSQNFGIFLQVLKNQDFLATAFVLKLQLAVYFAGRCVRDVVVVGGAPSVVSAHKWSARSALAAKLRLHRRNAQRRPGVSAERSAVRPG